MALALMYAALPGAESAPPTLVLSAAQLLASGQHGWPGRHQRLPLLSMAAEARKGSMAAGLGMAGGFEA